MQPGPLKVQCPLTTYRTGPVSAGGHYWGAKNNIGNKEPIVQKVISTPNHRFSLGQHTTLSKHWESFNVKHYLPKTNDCFL